MFPRIVDSDWFSFSLTHIMFVYLFSEVRDAQYLCYFKIYWYLLNYLGYCFRGLAFNDMVMCQNLFFDWRLPWNVKDKFSAFD